MIGGYASYWVYQHLGNLSPDQLDEDEVYARVLAIADDEERTRYLDDVAWQADVDATSIRWSYYRDLGGADGASAWSRSTAAARGTSIRTTAGWSMPPSGHGSTTTCSTPDRPYDHLVLASTLPFLMLPGVHHLEGWDEAISEGAWGARERIGERCDRRSTSSTGRRSGIRSTRSST